MILDKFDLQEFANAVDSGAPKPILTQLLTRSINLPKPVLAMAYMKIQSMPDEDLRKYCKMALQVMAKVEAGEDIEELLTVLQIPKELSGMIKTYANLSNQKSNQD